MRMGERAQQFDDRVGRLRVKVSRRLVGGDQIGAVREGPGNGDALLLAAAELARLTRLLGPGEPDLVSQQVTASAATGPTPLQSENRLTMIMTS